MKQKKGVLYFSRYLIASVGLVLIWRGLWFLLDQLEVALLGGNHVVMAVISIALGMGILYRHGHDFL